MKHHSNLYPIDWEVQGQGASLFPGTWTAILLLYFQVAEGLMELFVFVFCFLFPIRALIAFIM